MRTPLLTSSCIAISSFAVALLGSGCLLISKTRGGNTPAEVDPKVAATLGESARYSVRAAQGASSLCPVDDPTDQPLGVWAVEGGASPELWCFPVPKARFGASTDWGTVRAIQDASALRTVLENTEADERGLSLTFDDAGMIAMIEHAGGEFAVARIALPGPRPADLGSALALALTLDPATYAVDVLLPSAAAAQAHDLSAAQVSLQAEFRQALATRHATYAAADAARVDAGRFPGAGMHAQDLVDLVRTYLASADNGSGVAPDAVVLIRVSSPDWEVRKDEYGDFVGLVADVAVGYRTREGGCAYTSLQVQRDYAGGGTYATRAYVNGMQSIPVALRCERIE